MYQLGIDVSKKTLDICLMHEGVRGRLKTKKVKMISKQYTSSLNGLNTIIEGHP